MSACLTGRGWASTASRAPGFDEALQNELSRDSITAVLALAVVQPRPTQSVLGDCRGEPLVPEDDWEPGGPGQPRPELPRFGRFLAFLAASMQWQPDDQSRHSLRSDKTGEKGGVGSVGLAGVGVERGGDQSIGVRDRQTNPDCAEIDPQQPPLLGKRRGLGWSRARPRFRLVRVSVRDSPRCNYYVK